MQDLDNGVSEYLIERQPSGDRFWDPTQCFSFHTAPWWRRHWEQTRLVDVDVADTLPHGWHYWLTFEEAKVQAGANRHTDEIPALRADEGRYLGFVRMIGRRNKST